MSGTPWEVPLPRNVNENDMLKFSFAERHDNSSNVSAKI